MKTFIVALNAIAAVSCLVTLAVIYFKYNSKKYLKMSNKKDFTLVQINPGSENMMESFGITEERINYLIKKSNEIARKHSDKAEKGAFINVANILEEISKECVHQNELAVIALQIGGSVARLTKGPEDDFLRNLLNNLEN